MRDSYFDTYFDFYTRGPYSRYVSRACCTGREPLGVIEIDQPAGSFPDPPMPEFALFLVVDGNASSEFRYGDQLHRAACVPGCLGLAPSSIDADYRIDGPLKLIGLCFPESVLADFTLRHGEAPRSDFGRFHQGAFEDPLVQQLVLRVAAECVEERRSRLFVDSALHLLLSLLLDRSDDTCPLANTCPSDVEWRQVTEYIDANIGDTIRVADLSAILGVSERHFVRLFRNRMSTTPYRYVLDRRTEAAAFRIRSGTDSIAAIALDTGFASQSHLTTMMKRLLGKTPGELRKDERSDSRPPRRPCPRK